MPSNLFDDFGYVWSCDVVWIDGKRETHTGHRIEQMVQTIGFIGNLATLTFWFEGNDK